MIEAMACGTPVAAYPVEGPKDAVIPGLGGYLSDDLESAIEYAATLPIESVLNNAHMFSWKTSADVFFGSLVNIR